MTDISASLRALSEPRSADEFVKDAIARAAEASGLSFWRAFDIWYGKARYVRDFEITAVVSALEKKQRRAARNELHELRTRLTRLESLLAQTDPDFHRENLNQVGGQLRALGGKSSAVDRA